MAATELNAAHIFCSVRKNWLGKHYKYYCCGCGKELYNPEIDKHNLEDCLEKMRSDNEQLKWEVEDLKKELEKMR